jgi:hypothetical protein
MHRTPLSPTTTKPKPILKPSTTPSPISPIPSLSKFALPTPPSDPHNPHPSLQNPLKTHLALLHPSTPSDIVAFCAIRLLSTDRPYGYKGDWVPIWQEKEGVACDLTKAGVGLDAGKSYKEKMEEKGWGAEVDKRLEGMYRAARESWGLLENKGAGSGVGSR